MPRYGQDKWKHVDDVDTKTFDKWTKTGTRDDFYSLYRPHDLTERAKDVRVGDQLLMVDCWSIKQPKAIFNITHVTPSSPPECFHGTVFIVKIERVED